MLQRILRTKITPPPRNTRTLVRPRVTDLLTQASDYRLTVLHAEAGYGKSTALAELVEAGFALAWYQLNAEDNDPLIFLLHLCQAFLQAVPDLPGLPDNGSGSCGRAQPGIGYFCVFCLVKWQRGE